MRRTFTIHYKEIIEHDFEYQAESAKEAERMFHKDADAGILDFGDGEVIDSEIASIEETTESVLYWNVRSFLSRVFSNEYSAQAECLINDIMADVKTSSNYPLEWNETDVKLAFARVVLEKAGCRQ